jgi:hypothetical protein
VISFLPIPQSFGEIFARAVLLSFPSFLFWGRSRIAAFLLIVPAIVTRIAPDPLATLMIWCVIVPSELALCFLRRVDTVYGFAEMLPLCGTASCFKFPTGVRSGFSVENPISFRSKWLFLLSRSFFSGFPI